MKVAVFQWLIWAFLIACACGKDDYTLVTDHEGDAPLNEAVCYLRCLSDALNNLYSDGEKRLFVNEEAYANASRILDDMEGRAGESVRYLSVISGSTEGKHDKLEKLISYGSAMGDLVAKVGGLFAEVNESVRAVREVLPSALIRANKYYTAVAKVVRTFWDDVKSIGNDEAAECGGGSIVGVRAPPTTCRDHRCSLGVNVTEEALREYKDGCLEINVMTGSVSTCFNIPRRNLFRSGAEKHSSDVLIWPQDSAARFQLTVEVQRIFVPLISLCDAGLPPSVLLPMMVNITSFYSHFKEAHRNFTSLLLGTNITDSLNLNDSTI